MITDKATLITDKISDVANRRGGSVELKNKPRASKYGGVADLEEDLLFHSSNQELREVIWVCLDVQAKAAVNGRDEHQRAMMISLGIGPTKTEGGITSVDDTHCFCARELCVSHRAGRPFRGVPTPS